MKKKREIAPEFARYLPMRGIKKGILDGVTLKGKAVIFIVLTAWLLLVCLGINDIMTAKKEVCINGECGFELGCVSEVTIEIASENGVQILQQQCVKEGWTRDTDYAKELREAGFKSAEVRFD